MVMVEMILVMKGVIPVEVVMMAVEMEVMAVVEVVVVMDTVMAVEMEIVEAGKGGLMTSFHLGFHQDEAVLLNGNKAKMPPKSVGQCTSGALGVGEREFIGVRGGLHRVCGGRGADQFGLDS